MRRWQFGLALIPVAGWLACGSDFRPGPVPAGAGGEGASGGDGGTAGDGASTGGGVNTGGGGGAECTEADQCPGVESDCEFRTCEGGVCGIDSELQATACSDGGGQHCDGMGECVPSEGDPEWVKHLANLAGEGASVDTDAQGNVYVLAAIAKNFDFGGGLVTVVEKPDSVLVKYDADGNFVWQKHWDTVPATGVAAASDGGVYIVGVAADQFDPGMGVVPNGPFVAKYDKNGVIAWQKAIVVSSGYGEVLNIAANADGVVVVGEFTGSLNVGATQELEAKSSTDVFVVKYDALGDHAFSMTLGSSGALRLPRVAMGDQGNVVVALGTFSSATMQVGSTFISVPEGAAIVMLNPNGDYVWHALLSGSVRIYQAEVALGPGGEVGYIAECDDSVSAENLTLDVNGNGPFVVKLDGSGNVAWGKSFTGDVDYSSEPRIAIDPAGRTVFAFSFIGNVDLGGAALASVGTDLAVAKLDIDGKHMWSKRIGGSGSEGQPDLSIDPLGNIVFAAAFEGTVDIDGTLLTNTNTSIDLMLVSFDP